MLRYLVPRLPQVNINLQQLPSLHHLSPFCPFYKRKERELKNRAGAFFTLNGGTRNWNWNLCHFLRFESILSQRLEIAVLRFLLRKKPSPSFVLSTSHKEEKSCRPLFFSSDWNIWDFHCENKWATLSSATLRQSMVRVKQVSSPWPSPEPLKSD